MRRMIVELLESIFLVELRRAFVDRVNLYGKNRHLVRDSRYPFERIDEERLPEASPLSGLIYGKLANQCHGQGILG